MTHTPLLPCLALIRVSTKRQQDEEQALDNQAGRLRDPGDGIPYKPFMIYEEIASARGSRSLKKRDEFQQVWREAHQQGVPLMVTSASRLSRHCDSFEKQLRKMPVDVIILDEGGLVSHERLLDLISQAEANGDKIAEGASRYVKERIASGKRHGSIGTQSKAGKKSGEVRASQKHDKNDELIEFLDRNPELIDASRPAVLKALNDLQLYTVRGKPWTADALRKKLRIAKQELLDRRQMEIEVEAEPFDLGLAKVDVEEPVAREVDGTVSQVADVDAAAKAHPDFGRFGLIEPSTPAPIEPDFDFATEESTSCDKGGTDVLALPVPVVRKVFVTCRHRQRGCVHPCRGRHPPDQHYRVMPRCRPARPPPSVAATGKALRP